MIARRTLLKDLAQQLNLSTATVSRALAGVPSVSPSTQQRVRELANSLNFQVNLLAAGLRRGRTGVIGVIVPAFTGHFFPEVLHSITTAASKAKLRVIICESNEDEQQEQEQLLWLLTAQVDGLLVSVVNAAGPSSLMAVARQQGAPVVFFNQAIDCRQANCVLLNYYQGAYEGVRHLAAQNRTRIAHLTGAAHLPACRDQQRGYAESLEDQGLLLDQRLVRTGDLTLASGRQHMLALLSGAVVPDAIFASHELVAIGAMQVIKEHGLRIPEDIALAAFASESMAALTMPALTSLNLQGSEMGKTAVHLLLKLLEDTHHVIASQRVVLNPTLLVRESSVATDLRPLSTKPN